MMSIGDLDLLIARLRDSDTTIQHAAVNALHDEVREAQGSSFTEIQKLLDRHKEILSSVRYLSPELQKHLYDLLSVISTLDSPQNTLRYRLLGGVTELSLWSHHYVRKLASAIADVIAGNLEYEEYHPLVEPIIAFFFRHNSETEAIDFAIEVSRIKPKGLLTRKNSLFSAEIKNLIEPEKEAEIKIEISPRLEEEKEEQEHVETNRSVFSLITKYIDNDNWERVTIYIEELSRFYDIQDLILEANKCNTTRYLIYLLKFRLFNDAISFVKSIEDHAMKKQCLYILARNSVRYAGDAYEERILSNSHMHGVFTAVATSLEVLPTKKLEYMFKGLNKDKTDVTAIANALVHFGFQRDPVFYPGEEDYKIRTEQMEHFKVSESITVAASVGLIHAFDPEKVYEVYESRILTNPDIGPILALALSSYRNGDDGSVILNLLSLFLTSSSTVTENIAALFAISLLYNSTHRQEIHELVLPLLSSSENSVSLFSIYVLGCVFPGDVEILGTCARVYKELKKDPLFTNFALLGLAAFFYKMNLEPESPADKVFDSLDPHARVLARGFMGLGTGNPSTVDTILAESFIGEIDALLESIGLLSACMVGIGDPISIQLIERLTTSSLLLDSPHLKNLVPLCLALLYTSNPKSEVLDILEKSINSGECSVNAIVAIGVVGAGSCSSRIVRILNNNFNSLYKDPRASAALVYARGLVNLGKGLLTLSPLCYDKQIILPHSLMAILSTFFLFIDTGSFFKDYSFLLYFITGAVTPRYVHLDVTDPAVAEREIKSGSEFISVKIGKPVDTVGMAGKPSRVSATVVHTLPAILTENERALADADVCTSYIEDIIVLKDQ